MEKKKPLAWITVKGRHIPIFDEDEKAKYDQIKKNQEVAAKLNGNGPTLSTKPGKVAELASSHADQIISSKKDPKKDMFKKGPENKGVFKGLKDKFKKKKQPIEEILPEGDPDPAKRMNDLLSKKGISNENEIADYLRNLSPQRRNRLAVEMGVGGRGEEKTKEMAKRIFLAGKHEDPGLFTPTVLSDQTMMNKYGFIVSYKNPAVTFTDAHWKKMKDLRDSRVVMADDPFRDVQFRTNIDDRLSELGWSVDEETDRLFNALDSGDLTDDEYWAAYHLIAERIGVKAPRYAISSKHGGEAYYDDGLYGTKEAAFEMARAKGYQSIYDRYTGEYKDVPAPAKKSSPAQYESILGPRSNIEDLQTKMKYIEDNKIINPNFKFWGQKGEEYKKWHHNCALCSTAVVLQARGYDVEAGPRDPNKWRGLTTILDFDNVPPENYLLGNAKNTHANFGRTRTIITAAKDEAIKLYPRSNYNNYLDWKAAVDKHIEDKLKAYDRMPTGAKRASQAIQDKMKEWGPDSIAELSVDWKNTHSAHSIVVMWDKDRGKAYIYDGQDNTRTWDIESYLQRTTASHTQLVRVDNVPLKKGIENDLDKMVKKRKKPSINEAFEKATKDVDWDKF